MWYVKYVYIGGIQTVTNRTAAFKTKAEARRKAIELLSSFYVYEVRILRED